MRELGVSIYPDKALLQENKEYLTLASKYGFTRVFTCLLSIEGNEEKIIGNFAELVKHGNKLGMKTIADVSPKIFEKFNLNYNDLSFFKQLGLYGIRLDLGFSGNEESIMSFSKENIKIEINMSNGTKYLENILEHWPNTENILGCHNFYPHKYTGISREHFLKCSRLFKTKGIRTAAFISSNHGKFGPWPISEGLCTLEEHRGLPIEVQAKDLFNTNLIDDVIIGNCFASEDELKLLSELNKYMLVLNVDIEASISDLEKKIVIEEFHFNRGDVSEYMIRSTQSRVKYKGHEFKIFNPKDIEKGDILIESSLYDRYAGELQIALRPMKNSGKTNVVGKIASNEIFLLDKIKPWQKFQFKLKK
ncbi:MAG: DUF871 domain-containing protein [Firmicutes bacterium]|nr:DUF871 domain-containing protein [Bacillota bacterium]